MWKQLSNILAMILGTIFLLPMAHSQASESLSGMLKQSCQDGKYQPTDSFELAQVEALFGLTLQNPGNQQLIKDWQTIGFDMFQHTESGNTFVILREQSTRREGRGFYAIRTGKTDKLLLQAPHSFKDERTGEIVVNLMLKSKFTAAAWNTVPRYYAESGRKIDADMAHLDQTYFLAFSRAFAQQYKGAPVMQVHGFAQKKRRSGSGKNADMVISSGTSNPTATVLNMAACFKNQLTPNAFVYPSEVRELGGTTNSIGNALRQLGNAGFVHIEMSAELRQQAIEDPAFTDRFLGCLAK